MDAETREKIKTLYPGINVINDLQDIIDNPEITTEEVSEDSETVTNEVSTNSETIIDEPPTDSENKEIPTIIITDDMYKDLIPRSIYTIQRL